MTDILDAPLAAIAAALRDGETTAEGLTNLAIDRHTIRESRLHAYKSFDAEKARCQARAADAVRTAGTPAGALFGLPISAKDLFGVEGFPIYAGTRTRLPSEWEREGFLIGALRSQFAIMMGKTHMVEVAFGGLGTNPHWDTPINPWDASEPRVPGGSSSGAGVSLWEGSAVVALGSDTAGSIRIPASMTGVVGLKTTLGRWPTTGVFPLSSTLDSIGPLTRTVADAAYFFAAVDPHLKDPGAFLEDLHHLDGSGLSGIRIGIVARMARGIWEESAPDIAETVRTALSELEAKGARLVEIDLPEFDQAYDLYMSGRIVPPECAAFLRRRLPGVFDTLHEIIGERLRGAATLSATDYLNALADRRELADGAAARLDAIDILVTPTLPITPPRIADVSDLEGYIRENRRASRATNPVNVLDLCAISIPCGLDSSNMPVGLQLVGRNGEDERLLAIAARAERVLGTAIQRMGTPPLLSLDSP